MTGTKNNFYQETNKTTKHYEKIAQSYNSFWYDIDKFVSPKIADYLEIKSSDNFVDLGCGTGLIARTISEQINLINPIVCVDISEKMLEEISSDCKYKPVVMDVIKFSSKPGKYDKILVKGMIHHINNKKVFLSNLFDRLNLDGILLIVMHPPTLKHPLFNAALKRYEDLQPHYDSIIHILNNVGFKTNLNFINLPISINKIDYIDMITNNYMSFLSSFERKEIEIGINEINQKYSNCTNLNFEEILVFITAKKYKL